MTINNALARAAKLARDSQDESRASMGRERELCRLLEEATATILRLGYEAAGSREDRLSAAAMIDQLLAENAEFRRQLSERGGA